MIMSNFFIGNDKYRDSLLPMSECLTKSQQLPFPITRNIQS